MKRFEETKQAITDEEVTRHVQDRARARLAGLKMFEEISEAMRKIEGKDRVIDIIMAFGEIILHQENDPNRWQLSIQDRADDIFSSILSTNITSNVVGEPKKEGQS